jgi:alpha-1,4-digalacturonate transport system permease protein
MRLVQVDSPEPVKLISAVLALFFNLFEPLFKLGQRLLGVSRLGWLFVMPNLVVFGFFTFCRS